MIFNKFFRWLYNPDEPEPTKRVTPPCMVGIRKLPRKEKSQYKPSSLRDALEHAVFLKYCPRKRDRCYHAMANDMSARPHEILNLERDLIACYLVASYTAEIKTKQGEGEGEGKDEYKAWIDSSNRAGKLGLMTTSMGMIIL